MSNKAKGARLWLKPGYTAKDGRTREAKWFIRDGDSAKSTGFGADDREAAEKALADYIAAKYQPARDGCRSATAVPLADVLSIWLEDKLKTHSRADATLSRAKFLIEWFGDRTLDDMTARLCMQYAESRGSASAARRELEDLRAAINYHRKLGLCREVIEVTLPEKEQPRERWLTPAEAARLLRTAWRMEAKTGWHGATVKRTGKHIARFILIGLYTGTRAGAICEASFTRVSGRGYIDLERGVFYRKAVGRRATNKRQPTVQLHPSLLAHLRRWHRLGICKDAAVEWEGLPVRRVSKGFASAARLAGLEGVSPHTLRHTAATWMRDGGVEIEDACKYLGMTREVLERIYAHVGPKATARVLAGIRAGRR